MANNDITASTSHEDLVASVPKTYFDGHLQEVDLSPHELCAVFCLITPEMNGPVKDEVLFRLQHPPIPVEATKREPVSRTFQDSDRLRDACTVLAESPSESLLEVAQELLDLFQNDGYHDGSIKEGPWLAARDVIESAKVLLRSKKRLLVDS